LRQTTSQLKLYCIGVASEGPGSRKAPAPTG
jgi:hypothetical protein